MKKTLILFAFCVLPACSAITVKDSQTDALVGSDRQKEKCSIYVSENYSGEFNYSSDSCNIVVHSSD